MLVLFLSTQEQPPKSDPSYREEVSVAQFRDFDEIIGMIESVFAYRTGQA